MVDFSGLNRAIDFEAKLRRDAADGENPATGSRLQSITEDSAISDHHGKVFVDDPHGLSKLRNFVRAVLHADDVLVFAQSRRSLRLDFDSSQIGHAVKNDRNRRRVSHGAVMINQGVPRDRWTIVVRCYYQRSFRASFGGPLDLVDRAAGALLSRANYERECFRNGPTRDFDYLKIFAFINIDAISGRVENDI